MKSKTKILLGAVFIAVLCLCMVAGATFAIFTTEDGADIDVEPGLVDVNAEIISSTSNFNNGGDSEFMGNTVTISNVGVDTTVSLYVEFPNHSTVATKCRLVLMSDASELAQYINGTVTFEGKSEGIPFCAADTFCTEWLPYAEMGKSATIELKIPADSPMATSTVHNRVCNITFAVEAVQSNLAVTNGVAKIGNTPYYSLQAAAAALNDGDTLEILHPGFYRPFGINKNDVTVKGIVTSDRNTSTVIKMSGETDAMFVGAPNVTFENIWFEDNRTWFNTTSDKNMQKIGMMIATNLENTPSENLTIRNCRFSGAGSEYYEMAINTSTPNLTVENCHFENLFAAVVSMTKSPYGHFTISDNYFEDVMYATQCQRYLSYDSDNPDIKSVSIQGNMSKRNSYNDKTIFDVGDMSNMNSNTHVQSITPTVSNNDGDYVCQLNCFYGDSSSSYDGEVVYRRRVEIKAFGFEPISGSYDHQFVILDRYGNEVVDYWIYNGNQPMYIPLADGGGDTPPLTEGDYYMLDKSTGIRYPFTVYFNRSSNPEEQWKKQIVDIIADVETYHINNYDELSTFADFANSGYDFIGRTICLDNDIDCPDSLLMPIGTENYPFHGTFDGQGYTISNLKINRPAPSGGQERNTGLFGYIDNAVIQNVNLNNANVLGDLYVGALVGRGLNSAINNCNVYSSVVTGTTSVGGIIGNSTNTVVGNCSVQADEASNVRCRIVAIDDPNTPSVEGCFAGGIIGQTMDGSETNVVAHSGNSVSNTDVFGERWVGGLAGYLTNYVEFTKGTATSSDGTTIDVYNSVTYCTIGSDPTSGIVATNVGGAVGACERDSSISYLDVQNCTFYGNIGSTDGYVGYWYVNDNPTGESLNIWDNKLIVNEHNLTADTTTVATDYKFSFDANIDCLEFQSVNADAVSPVKIYVTLKVTYDYLTVINNSSLDVFWCVKGNVEQGAGTADGTNANCGQNILWEVNERNSLQINNFNIPKSGLVELDSFFSGVKLEIVDSMPGTTAGINATIVNNTGYNLTISSISLERDDSAVTLTATSGTINYTNAKGEIVTIKEGESVTLTKADLTPSSETV